MNTLTATERGDLAQRMLPVAARITAIVHGDGDAKDIAHALDPLDRIELVAVIVGLGALADPDRTVAEALAFVTWDEQGLPITPPHRSGTVRDLIPRNVVTPSRVDELLIAEKRDTAQRLHELHGLAPRAIAEQIGVNERTVSRWKEGWVA